MDNRLPAAFQWLSREAVRSIDQAAVEQLQIPGLLLMENAARGVSDAILKLSPRGQTVILCGPGNNGGDGLAAGRILASLGFLPVIKLIRAGKPLSHDTQVNLNILLAAGVDVTECGAEDISRLLAALTQNDLIVDALLGTGVTGIVRTPFHEIIEAVNASPAAVVAVDVPSGLDCDNGLPAGTCVRADVTVTFVAMKLGFQKPESRMFTGTVYVSQIGLPLSWLNNRQQHCAVMKNTD